MVKSIVSEKEEEFLKDFKNIYALRYLIIEIVEAASLIGSHVLEACFNTAVESYREVFDMLMKYNVISSEIGEEMKKLTGLRNLVVHRYWVIDDLRIFREAKEGLKIVEKFIKEVEKFVKERIGKSL